MAAAGGRRLLTVAPWCCSCVRGAAGAASFLSVGRLAARFFSIPVAAAAEPALAHR